MNMDGDLLVAGGAKLSMQALWSISLQIDGIIEGSICAGDSSWCISSSTGSPIRFGLHQVLQVQTKPVVVM